MDRKQLFSRESDKSASQFIHDFKEICHNSGFIINNEETMDMAKTFTAHNAEVPEGFDLHMIQVCKPIKASKSLTANPERSILMPKFVMVFTKEGKTQVRYLSFAADDIANLVDDEEFPGSLAQTYSKIQAMIEDACN